MPNRAMHIGACREENAFQLVHGAVHGLDAQARIGVAMEIHDEPARRFAGAYGMNVFHNAVFFCQILQHLRYFFP